jgi:L-amino acid N-acyltransferase YncA
LLETLIAVSEADGYWTLQAQILAQNHASRALHRKCGFREVGYRERYGHIDNVWHDIVLFERRSDRAGGPDMPTKTCG